MQDHACLNGFAEADLIREQDARGVTLPHFVGDIHLVGQQAGARAHQTAGGGTLQTVHVGKCCHAQCEVASLVEVTIQQALLRCGDLHKRVQLQLGHRHAVLVVVRAGVEQEARALGHLGDGEFQPLYGGDVIPGLEA